MRTLKSLATGLGIAVCLLGSILLFGVTLFFAESGFAAVTKGNAHAGLALSMVTSVSLALTLLIALAGRMLVNSTDKDDKPKDDENTDE